MIYRSSKPVLYALGFLLFLSCCIYAGETGKIAGRVRDKKTDEALLGANIQIISKWENGVESKLSKVLGATTDVQGDYFILNIPPGKYSVKASYIGYSDEIITNVQVNIDKTTTLDFTLLSNAFTTEEVVITAYSAKKVEQDVTATKQVYNIDEVQSIAGVADIGNILELQADVIDDHFRGGRSGESVYLMSGGSIVNPLSNTRAFSPIVTGLEQVEVYTSGFSAEYGNAQSGVVNMVTKEATDKWETSLEFSTNAPYYKTWDGSVYSPTKMQFYNILTDPNEWLKENPTQPGRPLFDAGYGFGSTYLLPPYSREDSLHISRLGQVLWLQSMKDMGLEYKNELDYRLDFTTGGPIAKNLKLFVASRQNQINPIVPTPKANIERQVMSNLTWQMDEDNKFGLRFIYDYQFDNLLSSSWQRWLLDRTFGITKQLQNTRQVGLDWKHIFNQATVFDVKFNLLNVKTSDYIELLRDGQFVEQYAQRTNWVNYVMPSNFTVGSPTDDRGTQNITTYDFHGSILQQFNKQNLIKLGLQFSYYDVNVDQAMNVTNAGDYRHVIFNAFPYEGGVYLQDKMEFDGLIANIGLRYDFYNMNNEYFSDVYSPLRNPNYDESKPYLERGLYYDANAALKEKSKLYARLQPRIGISFPVTETSVFHLNYGTFTQRPTFNQIFYNQITSFNQIAILGNPRLKPENTKAYDIGLVNAFPYGIRLDVSAYYKDVTNLVETAYYYDEQQNVYTTYVNRDYADIKGFHINVEKSEGNIRGYIRYNFEAATGKSSNSLDAPVTYFEKPPVGQDAMLIPDPEDVYLDYDRSHKAVVNVRFLTDRDEGPQWGKFYPFGGLSISTTYKIYSGRPYTWDESGQGLKYNMRTPWEHDLRIRIEKRVPFSGGNLIIYGEGYNLLNEKTFSYSRTFNSNRNTVRYQHTGDGVLTYDEYPPYVTDQSVYLLANEPRRFRFGVIFKF